MVSLIPSVILGTIVQRHLVRRYTIPKKGKDQLYTHDGDVYHRFLFVVCRVRTTKHREQPVYEAGAAGDIGCGCHLYLH